MKAEVVRLICLVLWGYVCVIIVTNLLNEDDISGCKQLREGNDGEEP